MTLNSIKKPGFQWQLTQCKRYIFNNKKVTKKSIFKGEKFEILMSENTETITGILPLEKYVKITAIII